MITIETIKVALQHFLGQLISQNKTLFTEKYTFIQKETLIDADANKICDIDDFDLFGADIPQEKPAELTENNFDYTLLNACVRYKIKQSGKALMEGTFIFKPGLGDINSQIVADALLNGRIGILNEVMTIEGIFSQLCNLSKEADVKKISQALNQVVTQYNENLQKLAELVPDKKNILELKINTIFLPLPDNFDARSVQIASQLPNQEGTYRRSQVAHLYNASDPDGVEIIPMDDFESHIPAKGELFVRTQNDNEWYVYSKKVTNMTRKPLKFTQTRIKSLQGKSNFTNVDSLRFLKLINETYDEEFTLKYEFNKFGQNVADHIALDKHAYNIGAIASRIDRIIQFQSNNKVSKSNNKRINALKDKILEHKNKAVEKLVNLLSDDKFFKFNIDGKQLKAKYPCLIVTFKNENPDNKENSHIEGYAEFVTHLMIAQINICLKAKKLYPLVDRRQSFGFMTPTMTPVLAGVRLSLGLTPNQAWLDCVAKGIQNTDKLLQNFTFAKVEDELLDNKFRGGELTGDGHKYLGSFSEDLEKIDIPPTKEILNRFLDVVKNSLDQKKASAIFRSQSAKHDPKTLSHKEVLELLNKKLLERYYYLDEQEKKMKIYELKDNKIYELEFDVDVDKINFFLLQNFSSRSVKHLVKSQEVWLKEAIRNAHPEKIPDFFSIDEEYQHIYKQIMQLYKAILNEHSEYAEKAQEVDLEKNTRDLITTQNKVVEFLLQQKPLLIEDTSEDEDVNECSSPNYYSPSGMSALFAPLVAARRIDGHLALPFPYANDDFAYFELAFSWHRTLSDESFIRSDLVIRDVSNKIFKHLLANKIEVKKKNSFYAKLIEFCIKTTLQESNLTYEAFLNYVNSQNVPEIVPISGRVYQLIRESLPPYFNMEYLEQMSCPQVCYLDNNPCTNKLDKSLKTALELLKQLCNKAVPPKILVLDVTSSTQIQINQFLEEFNKQDKIPILVTASSMVKHSELGLDLWQGGENKAYLSSRVTDHNIIIKYELFLEQLKKLTQSTESGLGRFARRYIREKLDEVELTSGQHRLRFFPPGEQIISSNEQELSANLIV